MKLYIYMMISFSSVSNPLIISQSSPRGKIDMKNREKECLGDELDEFTRHSSQERRASPSLDHIRIMGAGSSLWSCPSFTSYPPMLCDVVVLI